MQSRMESPVGPLCSVTRHALFSVASHVCEPSEALAAEKRDQMRFERICARELLGEID